MTATRFFFVCFYSIKLTNIVRDILFLSYQNEYYLSIVHHFVEQKLKEKLLPVALIHIISIRAHYTFVKSERQAWVPFQITL